MMPNLDEATEKHQTLARAGLGCGPQDDMTEEGCLFSPIIWIKLGPSVTNSPIYPGCSCKGSPHPNRKKTFHIHISSQLPQGVCSGAHTFGFVSPGVHISV